MKIAVIGAGIVGVTSAYELARDGHDVTVLERHSSLAAEASFATTGVMAPAYVTPWAGASNEGSLLRSLLARPDGMHMPMRPDLGLWRWLWRWSKHHRAAPQDRQMRQQLLALSNYSFQRNRLLTESLKLVVERAAGLLVLMRSAEELDRALPHLDLLREAGIGFAQVDASGCHAVESGLNRQQALAGGIRLAEGEVANCRQFAHVLRDACEQLGVEFRFATAVRGLDFNAQRKGTALHTEQLALTTGFASSHSGGVNATKSTSHLSTTTRRALAAARFLEPLTEEAFDAIVIAAGVDATALFPSIGVRLPLQPVHGYSMTAPLRAPDRGPRGAVIDARHGATIARLGQRVRVAGGMELGGSSDRHRRAPTEMLFHLLQDWFPGCAHTAKPQIWKGARPMLPDTLPIVGASPRAGVWLNIGHGGSGWSLACGSARLLADQLAGRRPDVDPEAFSTGRIRGAAAPG